MSKSEESFGKMHFAVIAGLFAAFGSLFGKLFSSFDSDMMLYLGNYCNFMVGNELVSSRVLSGACVCLMLFCNACVWTFYVKALQSSGSSLPATVTCTATNYVASALLGHLLFNEVSGLLWWTGTLFVVLGLGLISHASKVKPKTH